jgi:hypothetical protein
MGKTTLLWIVVGAVILFAAWKTRSPRYERTSSPTGEC